MNAKDYLSRYEILDELNMRIENEGDKLPKCFGVEYLQEELPHRCFDVEHELESVISQVDDFRSAMILSLRYLLSLNWKVIMQITGYSESTVIRLHRKGLRQVQEILDAGKGGAA